MKELQEVVQSFVTQEYQKYVALKPGQRIVCDLHIINDSPVVVNSIKQLPFGCRERNRSKRQIFTTEVWDKILALQFTDKLRILLQEIKHTGREEVSVRLLPNGISYGDSSRINAQLRTASLPYRIYLRRGFRNPSWKHGYVVTGIVTDDESKVKQ